MGELLNNHESITGDFSDAKKVKWLNDLSKSDCFSDPRSLMLWQHYLIAFKITHVAFLNHDLTLLEGTVPTIWSLSALPKAFKAPSTGRTARHKQPQDCACCWRDQGEGQGFVLHPSDPEKDIPQLSQPCHSTGWDSEIHSSWWEMLLQSPLPSLPLSCSFSISLDGFFSSLPKLPMSFRMK